jgi:DNA-binding NarL/FixJ family response regulator
LQTLGVGHADIAVVDVRMPPTFTDEGLRAAIQARRLTPGFPVLVLSQYVEQLYARELLGSGQPGVGYLLKDRVADVAQFLEAVQTVAAGGTVLDPEVVASLIARSAPASPMTTLTPREREVLELMAQGRSNSAIAQTLFITEKAVAKNTSNIFMKLGLEPDDSVNRRVQAVIEYLRA